MDDYLARLGEKNPGGLQLAPGINARENGRAVAIGEGAWRFFRRIRAGQTFADPANGQVAFMGVGENDSLRLVPLFVRLKISAGRIAESEIIFNSDTGRFFEPSNLLEPDVLYDAVVPEHRRSSRRDLVTITNRYLDALHTGDAITVPFSPRCDKFYAGARVTNREGGVGDCAGAYKGLTLNDISNRRFPIVDEERGVVVSVFFMPNVTGAVRATLEVEMFKIVDGLIRSVDELGQQVAYPPESGFPQDWPDQQ